MGILILVSGENSSGKSLFAEKIAARCTGKHYYIATMIPKTEDNYIRIKKHKKQREGLGFTDLELPYSLSEALNESDSVVLIEDVSNLLANNIFDKNKSADEVFNDILQLIKKSKIVVAVTISGLRSRDYDEETVMYIDSLNEINQKLYNEALIAIKMKNGKPVFEKGENYDIF
ncbi:MAG: bifunctional adenosylcobinamide kinase/adenosylcobinamide-phosphate guanylyltransferase [Clostridia bacterium]|nr:bifunctional adenosylcobinamide kinase/adenosylcobinamide-phosphate guanylyltransferase [Clostridia bacterium]